MNPNTTDSMNLLHIFIPHEKHNYRAKLLHNLTLLILVLSIGVFSSLSIAVYKSSPEVLGVSYQITVNELLNLTNYERSLSGKPPLTLNEKLSKAAEKKALHMFENNYWAHFAPDGTSPWDFIRGEDYDYAYAGENLAKGFTTSYDTVEAWMASQTHRDNLLSSQYDEVGFAIIEGRLKQEDTVLIVQELGSTDTFIASDRNSPEDSRIAIQPEVRGLNEIPVGVEADSKIVLEPMFDIRTIARSVTFVLLSALLIALVLDFVIMRKKKIPRVVGNNLDHIILVTIFIAFVFMVKIGQVI